MRILFSSLSLIAAAVLAGCAVPTAPGPSGSSSPGAATAPAGPTLAQEQQRLAEALAGTPVVVETVPEGSLRVQVPMEFSFDVGRAVVKPPLAAVLDRMATGLKARAGTEIRISAPTDPKGAGGLLLAQDRAAAARDYLVARGVPAVRFGKTGRAEALEVLVVDKPAAPR